MGSIIHSCIVGAEDSLSCLFWTDAYTDTYFFYHDAAPNSYFRGVDAEAEEGT